MSETTPETGEFWVALPSGRLARVLEVSFNVSPVGVVFLAWTETGRRSARYLGAFRRDFVRYEV